MLVEHWFSHFAEYQNHLGNIYYDIWNKTEEIILGS